MTSAQELELHTYETGLRCHYCFKRLIDPRTPLDTAPYYQGARLRAIYGILSYDHKIARSNGGANASFNRVPSCQACNCAKASGDYDEFLALTETQRQLNQIDAALDILANVVGVQFVGEDKLITGREYNIAKRVLRRASYKIRSSAQAVNHAQ